MLFNILEFKSIPRPKDEETEESNETRKFLVDNNTTLSLMA